MRTGASDVTWNNTLANYASTVAKKCINKELYGRLSQVFRCDLCCLAQEDRTARTCWRNPVMCGGSLIM